VGSPELVVSPSQVEVVQVVDEPKLQLCSVHGQSPVEVCTVCRCVLGILCPNIHAQVLQGQPVTTESFKSGDFEAKFISRTNVVEPSMILPESALIIGKGVFNRPAYKTSHFESLVNKHLRVSSEQNETLNKNLRNEAFFRCFEKEKGFFAQSNLKQSIVSCLRDLKVA
jgi:hypothetical protein